MCPDTAPDTEDSTVRASRRARSMIRRYLVANKLRYMWTLTFAEATYDHATAMQAMAAFLPRLRATFPQVGPYLFVGEPHPGGHGWHFHMFVGNFLDWGRFGRAWGHGFVKVTDWGRRKNRGKTLRERVRCGAGYAAKYATKSLAEVERYGCSMDVGEHRYERSQGHDARVVAAQAVSLADAREQLAVLTGGEFTCELWLSDDPGWRGPPLLYVAWAV